MDARRRSRSAPQRLIERLLGLDMKMRQYEQGKVFCDAVAAEAGIEALEPGLGVARGAADGGRARCARSTGWRAWARRRPAALPRPAPRGRRSL